MAYFQGISLKRNQRRVNQCAKDNEHPLVSEIEPVADDE